MQPARRHHPGAEFLADRNGNGDSEALCWNVRKTYQPNCRPAVRSTLDAIRGTDISIIEDNFLELFSCSRLLARSVGRSIGQQLGPGLLRRCMHGPRQTSLSFGYPPPASACPRPAAAARLPPTVRPDATGYPACQPPPPATGARRSFARPLVNSSSGRDVKWL